MCCPGGEFQKLRLRGVKPMDVSTELPPSIAIVLHLRTRACVAWVNVQVQLVGV